MYQWKSYLKNKYIYFLIVILIVLTYYISMQVNKINILREEVILLEKKYNIILEKANYTKNIEDFKRINSCIFISELDGMAQQANLQVLNFQKEKNKEFAGIDQFTYNILLYGEMANFINWLNILEKKSYFFNIDKINIKNDNEDGENKFFLIELII